METIQILLADDHYLVASGLKHLIERNLQYRVVGIAKSGREALSLLEQSLPSLLITDLNMPDMDGIQLIEQAKARFPQLQVLVLSMHRTPSLVDKAVSAGASGYIFKEHDIEEVISAIDAVMNGHSFFSGAYPAKRAQHNEDYPDPYEYLQKLSKRELQILRLLGQSMTNKEVAKRLNISELTVQTHRRNINKKLKVEHPSELIHIVRKYQLHHPEN